METGDLPLLNKKTCKEEKRGILILGASGLIGGYLFDYFKKNNIYVIGTYNKNKKPELIHFNIISSSLNNLSLTNLNYAIICSAIAKVDECKKDPKYSYRVNVIELKRIINELEKKRIIPVFMSSASVFDGVVGGYKEDDQKNPASIYGKQKAEVEDFILSNIKEYLIIRPGKVFGVKRGDKSLFTDWLQKYEKKEKILCANDEKLALTYAEDVARGIWILIKNNCRGTYHLNPQKHYNRFGVAEDFFNYLGIEDVEINECSIDDFDFLEKRSKNTFLNASKFIKETQFEFTTLEDCYKIIKNNFNI